MKINKLMTVSLVLLSLSASSSVMAATQGTVGTTSNASIGISVSLLGEVQVSGLQDMTTSSWNNVTTGFPIQGQPFCIYSNQTNNTYYITVTGANPSPTGGEHSFEAKSNVLPNSGYFEYDVEFSQLLPNTKSISLQNGQKSSTSFTGSPDKTCSGGNNAKLNLQLFAFTKDGEQGQGHTMTSGLYTDTLTVLVTPN